MLAATLEYSTPRETDRATVTSTLLTQIDDALTAAAIVIGGAFAYLKKPHRRTEAWWHSNPVHRGRPEP